MGVGTEIIALSQTKPERRVHNSEVSAVMPKARASPPEETRIALSGRLSICSPMFSPSSELAFCPCSASVLALSVETGEQVFQLVGHTKPVTGMILLQPGDYGFLPKDWDSSNRLLLTSSLDGTLRLWDITEDFLSFEAEVRRCLKVLPVGPPVFDVFVGRTEGEGAALDVIVVTKTRVWVPEKSGGSSRDKGSGSSRDKSSASSRNEANASSRDEANVSSRDEADVSSRDETSVSSRGDWKRTRFEDEMGLSGPVAASLSALAWGVEDIAAGDVPVDGGWVDDAEFDGGGDAWHQWMGYDDSGDLSHQDVAEEEVDGSGEGKEVKVDKSSKAHGGEVSNTKVSNTKVSNTKVSNKRKMLWKVLRISLVKRARHKVLMVTEDEPSWAGTVAPDSPFRPRAGKASGLRRKGGANNAGEVSSTSCPVLLFASGAKLRTVTAIEVGTGDSTSLLKTPTSVSSMIVGEDGQQLVTGHIDGSISVWDGLYERLGAAFGVSGFQGAGKQPSTNLHWHAQSVLCMGIASDSVQLFSGGSEDALVQWNLVKGTKSFLPRLGETIERVAVSPSQEYVLVVSADNAVSLVGLAAWDVLWQLRGLALTPPHRRPRRRRGVRKGRRSPLQLTLEPRRGHVVTNGRGGHLQFYNPATDCVEASAELVRFNRVFTGKSRRFKHRNIMGPVVHRVAFSVDGKRMVAVTSRPHPSGTKPAHSVSFWNHILGADPYDSGYGGSYAGAKRSHRNRGGVGGGGGRGGTVGHWAQDTSVENPHGLETAVLALAYHPKDDVAVSAAEDGGFNIWAVQKEDTVVETLAATAQAAAEAASGGGGGGGRNGGGGGKGSSKEEEALRKTHWSCTLSIRYKAGLSAVALSFSSDGSVLAVSYIPTGTIGGKGKVREQGAGRGEELLMRELQGVVTLWSLETTSLLSTLLPPALRPGEDWRHLNGWHSLGFVARTGKVLSAGPGYAAVWDLVSSEATPLWQYQADVLAAATADVASVQRCRKAGISVGRRGIGNVALSLLARSLGAEAPTMEGNAEERERQKDPRGCVVLLLDAARPTPLHSWRLKDDLVNCLQLGLGDAGSGRIREGILCLTDAGVLLLLAVERGAGDAAPSSRAVKIDGTGLGVVHVKERGASAPGLDLCSQAKRRLLEVDLTERDRASITGSRKNARTSATRRAGDDGDDDDGADTGNTGAREAGLRSGRRLSDVLDPSSLNLAPVPEMYEAFMKTLLKPARQQRPVLDEGRGASDGGSKKKGRRGAGGAKSLEDAEKEKGLGLGGLGFATDGGTGELGESKPAFDEELLALFTKRIMSGDGVSTKKN